MRFMVGTDSAVVGATFLCSCPWIKYSFANSTVFLETFVGFVICPVQVFEVSMLGAIFGEYDLSISFYNCGVESF